MKKISLYIFSGLGTDERIFRNIHFPEFVDVHFVTWKKPERKESLEKYIDLLLEEFDLTNPIVLLGLSFGGVVVQEVSKKINPLATIIISSLSTSQEMPWYFRMYGNLKLNKITPFGFLKSLSFFSNRIFGAKSSDSKKLIREIMHDADLTLVKWQIEKILSWRSEKPPLNFFHLHGDSDKLLPLKNKNVNAIIRGGTHLMIYNNAAEIEKIIERQLEKDYREFNALKQLP